MGEEKGTQSQVEGAASSPTSTEAPSQTPQATASISQTTSSMPPTQAIAVPPQNPLTRFIKPALIGFVILVVIIGVIFILRTLLGRGGAGNEIVWWGLWEDEVVFAPLIEEFQSKNPGVKIVYQKQSQSDYRERLANSFAKGQAPDIFRFHNTWAPMFKEDLDSLPSDVMDASEFARTFYPIAGSDLTIEKKLVGIPLMYDSLTLFVNDEIFAQEGKAPPRMWDELRKVALELTKKDEEERIVRSGVALGRTENVDHWPEIIALMMIQNGVDLTDPKGAPAENALLYFTLFSGTDAVWDATLPPSTVAFAGGKVAMLFGPSWRAFEIKAQNPSLKFESVTLPQLPKEDPSEPNFSYATYWAEGVSAKSKNKKTAWKFLKFLSEKESLAKLYENEAKVRTFGEPYPRVDMAPLLASESTIGPIITQAPDARSWYLAARTFDGPTGINSQINKYFEDAINAVNKGTPPYIALEPVAKGVREVLGQYGLVSP